MNGTNLNLARKWRSKNFDQIIGQDLSVRMLKNSLYLEHYFPVYLFSGQRGCGKTTTARVFAAALNCEQLNLFRKDPKSNSVPCLTCSSCRAMLAGNHPDFIEIDAASHTGVDNVRQIIDASQLLPLSGGKKIYLIDEAHMLSKAAFNAFLKILEEPPSSVLFILATTDPQKIIETVKSRCFQLFFKPVDHDPLRAHLQSVCDTEKIKYEDVALDIIIKETEGSVRDALNVVEQVRFAHGRITKEAVLNVLGHIDDGKMLMLFATLLQKEPKELLEFLQTIRFSVVSAEFVWNKLIEMVRAALWLLYNVEPQWLASYTVELKAATKGISSARLTSLLQTLYENELLFLKTTAKHSLLEMILLQVCQKNTKIAGGGSGSSPISQHAATPVGGEKKQEEDIELDEEEVEEEEGAAGEDVQRWSQFLQKLDGLNDPLLSSIFKNGTIISFSESDKTVSLEFAKQFSFFKGTIEETKKLWTPLLEDSFGVNSCLDAQFTAEHVVQEEAKQKKESVVAERSNPQQTNKKMATHNQKPIQKKTDVASTIIKQIDLSDSEVWKKAHMVSRYFPGSFSEIIEA